MNEFENLISLLESPNKENFSLGLVAAQNYKKEIFEHFGCELEEIEELLGFLTENKQWNGKGSILEITELYFINTGINEFPKSLCILTKLKNLSFENNNLQKLLPEIGNLKNLEDLNLPKNLLKLLPAQIKMLKNL